MHTCRPTDEDNPAAQLVFHNPSSIRGLMTGTLNLECVPLPRRVTMANVECVLCRMCSIAS